jgi:hypothetical protein
MTIRPRLPGNEVVRALPRLGRQLYVARDRAVTSRRRAGQVPGRSRQVEAFARRPIEMLP